MKQYFTIISISILFILFYQSTVAQDIGKNNEKYWYYRERLKWFMIEVGPNAGNSIPTAARFDDGAGNRLLQTADDLNQLGWYIGVLATEWKLLHDEGSDTRNTEKELYYALYALRRLDNTDYCFKLLKQ